MTPSALLLASDLPFPSSSSVHTRLHLYCTIRFPSHAPLFTTFAMLLWDCLVANNTIDLCSTVVASQT